MTDSRALPAVAQGIEWSCMATWIYVTLKKKKMQHPLLYRPRVHRAINTSCIKGIVAWKVVQHQPQLQQASFYYAILHYIYPWETCVSISKNIYIALLLMLLCFTEPDQIVLMEKLHRSNMCNSENICDDLVRGGENKSLWLYFSSRELLHSALSISLCMTQWSLIPKEHKIWQFYFLFLPCFLLAVTVKVLDFFFDPSEENQSFCRKTSRELSSDNHCSFDFSYFLKDWKCLILLWQYFY